MEKVIDFDEWYLSNKTVEVEYWAVYDPDTGKVQGVYPNSSADAFKHKIKIDKDIGEAIGDGRISLFNCYIDFESDSLEIVEVQSLIKIDDILHRIIDSRWTNVQNPELTIKVKNDIVNFSLSEIVKSKKRIHYSGDTLMNFYITAYNDPNVLYEKITIQLDKLITDDITFKINNLPIKFSIYTRRIFKKYIVINENDRI